MNLMDSISLVFLRWVMHQKVRLADSCGICMSTVNVLAIWYLHYFNLLALLSKSWHRNLNNILDSYAGISCKLYLHCRKTFQCPRLLALQEPWRTLCTNSRTAKIEAAITQGMLFIKPGVKVLNTEELPPLCTLKYTAGITVIEGSYPPTGYVVAHRRHTSVPAFRRTRTSHRRTRSALL